MISKFLTIMKFVKELLTGDYKSLTFWSAFLGVVITVFGLDIDATTKAEIAGICVSVAGVIVAIIAVIRKLQSKKISLPLD